MIEKQKNHLRLPETTIVSLDQIRVDEDFAASDPIVQLYVKLEQGKIKVALTRLHQRDLHSGYFERLSGSTKHTSNLKLEKVPLLEAIIKSGGRPTVDAIWSPLAPSGGGYMCPDDELALTAYRNLGISMIPCRILKPTKKMSIEAAIWLEKRSNQVRMARSIPPKIDSIGFFDHPDDKDFPFEERVSKITQKSSEIREEIIKFHLNAADKTHFHQVLYALLRRHERILDSVKRLIELDRVEHASALVRVAYESFLNFYLDWLSPQFFGPRLQLLSYVREMDGAKSAYDEGWKTLSNFADLFENTTKKGIISPLGERIHRDIYAGLSSISHQSYVYLEHEASNFWEAEPPEQLLTRHRVAQIVDMVSYALISRVANEVGIDL